MTIIRAAAVQISPVLYSREGTVDKVVQTLIELGQQGVQFATFPETVVPYYPYFSFVQRPFEMAAEYLGPASPWTTPSSNPSTGSFGTSA
jgi:nitrilase